MKRRVDQCCRQCGKKYGKKNRQPREFFMGRCDICTALDSVIWAREYGIYEVEAAVMRQYREDAQ